jgi:hypothetical protein
LTSNFRRKACKLSFQKLNNEDCTTPTSRSQKIEIIFL